jgi:hypothetical protein
MATCLSVQNVTDGAVMVQEYREYGAKRKQQFLVSGELLGGIQEMRIYYNGKHALGVMQ